MTSLAERSLLSPNRLTLVRAVRASDTCDTGGTRRAIPPLTLPVPTPMTSSPNYADHVSSEPAADVPDPRVPLIFPVSRADDIMDAEGDALASASRPTPQ